MQEHQLLLEVSFVVAVTVFRDDLLEQIYSRYLKWLRCVYRKMLGCSA